jgi:hypothetical protein
MNTGMASYRTTIAALLLTLGTAATVGVTAVSAPGSSGYSAAQLYNQGNAYVRAGQAGLAVLAYERALLLTPGDRDIQANLRTVMERAELPPDTTAWFDRWLGQLGSRSWFWLGCIGILLAGASELARQLFPRLRITLRAVSAAGILGVGAAIYAAATLWPVMHEAVVIAPTTPQRAAPASMADPLRTLRAAQIVTVEVQRQNFALVRTMAGLTGWVLQDDLAPIVPRGS